MSRACNFDEEDKEQTDTQDAMSVQPGMRPSAGVEGPRFVLDGLAMTELLKAMAPAPTVKDSGKREQFTSGMQRDTQEGKIRFDLVFDGPMLERYAQHLTLGAVKYQPRNWMLAAGEPELARFRESACRHFFQWLAGEVDEDHAAAVWFNLNGYEYVKEKLK